MYLKICNFVTCMTIMCQAPLLITLFMQPLSDDSTQVEHRGIVSKVINYFRESNVEKDKGFDMSFVVGPFYDTTTSFAVGGGISAKYRWDDSDLEIRKSTMSLMAKVSVKGMVALDFSGMNYMLHDKVRWNYLLKVSNEPMDFWGIGYDMGEDDANKGSYDKFKLQFKPDFMWRLAPNLYAGGVMHINYTNTRNFENEWAINGQDANIIATGFGVVLQYDSRDYPTAAYRGHYVRAEQLFYPTHLNTSGFISTDITYSTYHQVWRSCTLAMEWHSLFNYGGEVPWTMLAQVAENSSRMRGYYEGRYRDRNIMEAQVELRQRLPKRFGVVVFAGAANVFDDFDQIDMSHTLPNYGVGLRWEFKQRVNLRLDVGMTKDDPGVVFNINEAF